MNWKPNWPDAREHFIDWWNGKGMVLWVTAPRPEPIEPVEMPPKPDTVEANWTDAAFRAGSAEYHMAHTFYAGDAFPYFDTQIGPGSLGIFLGAEPNFAPTTVWYDPCIPDPDRFGPIRFDPVGNKWFDAHMALIDEGLRRANGRYLVGIPDLIENIDTLAAMRGNQELLFDLIERPDWVQQRLAELNDAYFAAFDTMFEKVRDVDGGNAFCAFMIWGPGKTAKIQCDFSCMISPEMFRRFVQPHLAAQCEWLDYSLYHLDGTTAVQHVEALCEIESLNAIEWTPQAGRPSGGDPCWHDLYRQIKSLGKGVQAIGVKPDEVVPLIEAVGADGLFIVTGADDADAAERLVADCRQYR